LVVVHSKLLVLLLGFLRSLVHPFFFFFSFSSSINTDDSSPKLHKVGREKQGRPRGSISSRGFSAAACCGSAAFASFPPLAIAALHHLDQVSALEGQLVIVLGLIVEGGHSKQFVRAAARRLMSARLEDLKARG
jgi:hypothetical protein